MIMICCSFVSGCLEASTAGDVESSQQLPLQEDNSRRGVGNLGKPWRQCNGWWEDSTTYVCKMPQPWLFALDEADAVLDKFRAVGHSTLRLATHRFPNSYWYLDCQNYQLRFKSVRSFERCYRRAFAGLLLLSAWLLRKWFRVSII